MALYRKTTLAIAWVSSSLLAASALAAEFDQNCLHDYPKLQPRSYGEISDLVYQSPEMMARIAGATTVAVDQPEILFSPDSPYQGGKPGDMAAIAEHMRKALSEQLFAGGYTVVDEAGPGTILLRLALTDLELKKKKRGAALFGLVPMEKYL